MNTALIRRIADAIETEPSAYAQAGYGPAYLALESGRYGVAAPPPSCETPGCVAGWALALDGRRLRRSPAGWRHASNIEDTAADSLGLESAQAAALFACRWSADTLHRRFGIDAETLIRRWAGITITPTPEDAAAVLRAIADQHEGTAA